MGRLPRAAVDFVGQYAVLARFNNYGLPVSAATRAYMNAVMALPAWRQWTDAAMREPWIMRHNEPDWPLVRGEPVEPT